jgi:hypothetical protein
MAAMAQHQRPKHRRHDRRQKRRDRNQPKHSLLNILRHLAGTNQKTKPNVSRKVAKAQSSEFNLTNNTDRFEQEITEETENNKSISFPVFSVFLLFRFFLCLSLRLRAFA